MVNWFEKKKVQKSKKYLSIGNCHFWTNHVFEKQIWKWLVYIWAVYNSNGICNVTLFMGLSIIWTLTKDRRNDMQIKFFL